MRPDTRSVSFTFHREPLGDRNSPRMNTRNTRNLRQRLQDRFEKDKSDISTTRDNKKSKVEKDCCTEKGWSNLSLGNVSADSRRVLRTGAEKLSKTISSVRTTIGTISQKFRTSTRRRQILDEQQSPGNSACKGQTPQTRSRCLLGRTPTKLYSPFGIESPRRAWGKENDKTPISADSKVEGRRTSRPFRFVNARGFAALR
ncbi:uncharacterized protein [Venturia canescens]|uniref:uncharacterized protein n=1 Tax=Venturia canescens TaxID=32260 RepID=UPI001C9C8DAE|nr:uncharacterized protein LOC122413491 [Venturia canescens]